MDNNNPTLPKESKSKNKKILLFASIGAGTAVAVGIIILFAFNVNTQQYALSVEPRSEMVMGTGMMVRVYVKNTGSEPLTNINLNWGSTSDNLPILNSGEKVMFSPPASSTMVTVTADHGIRIMKSLTGSMQ